MRGCARGAKGKSKDSGRESVGKGRCPAVLTCAAQAREGGDGHERESLYRNRPEILLRFRGVPGARPGSAGHQPRRGGREPDGQDHLPGHHAHAQALRAFRPGAAVRGQAARPGGERRSAGAARRAKAGGHVAFFLGAASRSVSGDGFHHRAAANGVLYGVQQPHLSDLPQIRRAGGYRGLFHRRGVHGCDGLPEHIWAFGARPRHEDHPRRAGDDRHHGHGGNRHKPVSVQGGDGHCGQAHARRSKRRPHRGAGRNEIPPRALGASAHHGLLARGPGLSPKSWSRTGW